MSSTSEEQPAPDFEIDHEDEYAQYFLSNPHEISFYLNLLLKRGTPVSAHLDDGKQFFVTTMVAVDDEKTSFLLGAAPSEALNSAARMAHQITLTANLDRVKIQLRLSALQDESFDGQRALSGRIPTTMLRLQRRELFRLEPPQASPIGCRIVVDTGTGSAKTYEPKVADISSSGISLTAPNDLAADCPPGTLFRDCRLDLPGEGIVLVNLRVRETLEMTTDSGPHTRLGCEFVGLPGIRLAMIERYIARIERERKARDSGLAN